MGSTKKMAESSIVTSIAIIGIIISVSTGFGYAIYIDFIIPVFFSIIYLRNGLKYSILSSVSLVLIVSLVLGNIGTGIWASQSIILGITCGILLNRDSSIIDDLVIGSLISIIIMLFIDIYASKLIGYSFISEFKQYMSYIKVSEIAYVVYYMLIALFPAGMIFSIYLLTLILSKKINILENNYKKKYLTIINFKSIGNFVGCSKEMFYGCVVVVLSIKILLEINLVIDNVYINTLIHSSRYLCYYFIIRDSYTCLQNYIISKYKKILYARILSILCLIMLLVAFDITVISLIIVNIVLDYKIKIRKKQKNIVDRYIMIN